MWAAGAVAAMSSITFPAVSALVSRTADADQQGRFCPILRVLLREHCEDRCGTGVAQSCPAPEHRAQNGKIQVPQSCNTWVSHPSGTDGKCLTGPNSSKLFSKLKNAGYFPHFWQKYCSVAQVAYSVFSETLPARTLYAYCIYTGLWMSTAQ